MKRTMFYDSTTGALLHTHYEVRALEDAEDGATLSAPEAADAEAAVAELVARGLDLRRLGSLVIDEPPRSSRRVVRTVDVDTGALRSQQRAETRGDDRSETED